MAGELVHLTEEQLQGYAKRTLASDGLVRTDRHLATCPSCRRMLRELGASVSLPADVPTVDVLHLTFEQMTAFIDGQTPDAERERVETHALICKQCAQELNGLQAFEVTFAKQPEAVAAQVGQRVIVPLPRPGIAEWLSRFFAAPQRMRYVGVSLCLILFGYLTMSNGHGDPGLTQYGDTSMRVVTVSGASAHPVIFLGGILLIVAGIAGVLYGLFKKF
jgi:hypothetical protein